jgi:serine protease
MKKAFTFLFLGITLLGMAQTIDPNYVDGQIFLKFRTGTIKVLQREDPNNLTLTKIPALKELISKFGITKAYKPFYQADDDIRLTHILQVEFNDASKINQLIGDLHKSDLVEYAEKVMLLKTDVLPNDFATSSASVHLNQINAGNAWNIFNSTAFGNSNITVAIVDNAVAINHVDLTGNVWVNPGEIANNNIDDDNNGYVDDINGWDVADGDNNPIPSNNSMNHGTHCAGIAGARTDNGIGIASIGWNIKIIGVKCQNNTGNTTGIPFGYQGIIYAAKAKARVISCSWGGAGSASSAAQTVIDYAWNKGSIVIAAAGNSNTNALHYPAAYNNVYCVASVASNNVKSSFSNYGTWVDISAPGNNINSTLPGNNYGQQSGTSMATPMVAGLAGLMLSKYQWMTKTDVLNCISTTAANIYTISGNSSFSTGQQLGAGRIEAFAAMQCAASFTATPPIANFYTLTRNICPNTPVVFQDSSMYNATSWLWNFQGGTPATSTSSMPTVSYAAPGTYSVGLTASNSNGNSVANKVAYITVAAPINLPLQEGFQGTQFVPLNWSTMNIDNDSLFWKRQTGRGGFTVAPTAACAMFNNYEEDATGTRDEIRTPRYNFSNVANAKIRFDVAYKQYDNTANITPANPYSDTLELRLTTNCGVNWTSIYNKGGQTLSTSPGTLQASRFEPLATEWRTDSINISPQAAFQQNVMVGFVNRGRYGQALYVDNVNIFLPAPTMSVNSQSNACTGSAVTFSNLTTGAAGYTWAVSPAASISAPNGTNTNITFANAGTYTITLTANNGPVLNTLTRTVSIAVQPTVALTTSTTNICSGTNVTLTASGASSYSWSTGSTANSIVVTPTANTTYTVRGNNSGACFDVKSSVVNVTLTPNVSVTNQTICAAGTATLIASGASTYSWSTGSTSNPIFVSPTSNTVYTVIGFNNTCTNTKTVSVTIGASITIVPVATTPTICTGGTVGLSASGAATYTWLPGNINGSSLTVTPVATTNYTVNGTNSGCNGSAVISVSIISAPALVLTPSSSSVCAGGSSTINANGYSTYTWMPGNLSGNSQVFSPSANQVYTVSGNIGNCNGQSTTAISVIQIPTVSITGSTLVCSGNAVALSGNGALTYSWSNGSNNSSVSITPSSNTVISVTGFVSTCSNTAAISVSVNPTPTLAVSSSSNPICLGDAVNLSANGATSYTWSNGSTFSSIFIQPTVTITYTVTGTANGCSSQTTITQVVNTCGGVGIQTNSIENALSVFPNPSSGKITIIISNKTFDYVIYDNLGRNIRSGTAIEKSTQADLSEYAKGVYYIELNADGEKIRRKLILE